MLFLLSISIIFFIEFPVDSKIVPPTTIETEVRYVTVSVYAEKFSTGKLKYCVIINNALYRNNKVKLVYTFSYIRKF